ncbi:hypothetical protein OE88DRAFT_1662242 [Heliocybe sulcata]|uniref:Uncharacterized protein n=1 Tax=Heliocybe sulcata TaxID=5364 RepID=A0A5C3N797_9AGAM|nr:hypothetical protein OE88DRAFT_1662242 [Heliocybe sulcata]
MGADSQSQQAGSRHEQKQRSRREQKQCSIGGGGGQSGGSGGGKSRGMGSATRASLYIAPKTKTTMIGSLVVTLKLIGVHGQTSRGKK